MDNSWTAKKHKKRLVLRHALNWGANPAWLARANGWRAVKVEQKRLGYRYVPQQDTRISPTCRNRSQITAGRGGPFTCKFSDIQREMVSRDFTKLEQRVAVFMEKGCGK